MTIDPEDMSTLDLIDDVKAQISMFDLLDVMSIDYPRRSHGGVKISLRDETIPSAHIYEDHFFDYGTGEGGDVIDFYKAYSGKPWQTMRTICLTLLLGDVGTGRRVTPPKRSEPQDLTDEFLLQTLPVADRVAAVTSDDVRSPTVQDFIRDRWQPLTIDTLTAAGIRATRWGVLIPHRDWTGAFTGRYGEDDTVPVFGVKVRSANTVSAIVGSTFSTQLWVPRFAWLASTLWRKSLHYAQEWWSADREKVRHLIICEGESDTMAVTQFLFPNGQSDSALESVVVAGLPAGASMWRPEWLNMFDMDRVSLHIVADRDAAGAASSTRINDLHGGQVYETGIDARQDLHDIKTPGTVRPWLDNLRRNVTT